MMGDDSFVVKVFMIMAATLVGLVAVSGCSGIQPDELAGQIPVRIDLRATGELLGCSARDAVEGAAAYAYADSLASELIYGVGMGLVGEGCGDSPAAALVLP